MRRDAAIEVLENTFGELEEYVSASLVRRYLTGKKINGFYHWEWNREGDTVSANRIARYFADGFPGAEVAEIEKRIMRANPAAFDAKGRLSAGHQRVFIPEETVDLFEAYVEIALRPFGTDLRWVDDWFFHEFGRQLRGATNPLPSPHRPPIPWWKQPRVT